MVTLVGPLSREVGDSFLTGSGNFSRDIVPNVRKRVKRSKLPLCLTSAHPHQRLIHRVSLVQGWSLAGLGGPGEVVGLRRLIRIGGADDAI
jgi:hypothetical protein